MAGCHESSCQPHIDNISDEIVLKIFGLFRTGEILKLSRVCRRFNRLAHDQSLHKKVHFGSTGENLCVSKKVLQLYIGKHSQSIESIILLDCYWISASRITDALKACRNLHELNIIGCRKVSLKDLALLAARNPKLTRLGFSVPSKMYTFNLYESSGAPTDLNSQLCYFFGRLSSLKLRFEILSDFKTIISLFPKEMKLSEFCLEYIGPKSASIIHDGTDYHIHIKSKIPFSMYFDEKPQNYGNISLYFNVLFMNFATQIALNATGTKELNWLLAPGSSNIIAIDQIASYKTPSISMIDLSSTHLTPEKINWLGHLTNLTYLNLQHVDGFKANLMKVIAANCPNLITLNLNGCTGWIDEDLCALKTLCLCCLKLRHLNVGHICCHLSPSHHDDNIYSLVSKMKHLRSLSISPCCLVKSNPVSHSHCSRKARGKQSSLVGKPEVSNTDCESGVSPTSQSMLNAMGMSSQKSISPGYLTRHTAQQRDFEAKVIQTGSGLNDLAESLNEIETFELIAVGYSSVFSIPLYAMESFVCPVTRNLLDASFLPLRNWAKLKDLTLAGLHGLGVFNSLTEITKCCTNLEQLSLASIGLPGNAMALAALPEAVKQCHHLKKLRLDQPHFNKIDKLIESLQHCKNIEGILIACKNAKIPKAVKIYFDLFDECKKLCVFQLFSGAPGVLGKYLCKELTSRYQKERPPLSITIVHFNQSLTQDGLHNIPFAHIKTLTCFQSRVAQ